MPPMALKMANCFLEAVESSEDPGCKGLNKLLLFQAALEKLFAYTDAWLIDIEAEKRELKKEEEEEAERNRMIGATIIIAHHQKTAIGGTPCVKKTE